MWETALQSDLWAISQDCVPWFPLTKLFLSQPLKKNQTVKKISLNLRWSHHANLPVVVSEAKKACDWKLHVQIQSADQSDLIDQVKDELQSLIPTDIPVAAHPYQKIKSNSPCRQEHWLFWHLKHPRKNGATLSCPLLLRCNARSKSSTKSRGLCWQSWLAPSMIIQLKFAS